MSKKIKKSTVSLPPDNKFMSFARIVISIFMIGFMSLLSLTSLLHTTSMEIIGAEEARNDALYHIQEGIESVVYYNDGFIGNILWLVLFAVICFLIMPYLKKIPLWAELLFIGAWTITLGCIWVYSSMTAPSEDSGMVTNASCDFARNVYNILDDRYFRNYSFQLGYVFFNEIFVRIALMFGEIENLLFLEVINVVLLALAYVGIILINSIVFKDQRVRHLTVLLFTFAVQPIIFCTFLYGIIPGLTFSVYAVLCMILYFRKNNVLWAILSAILLMIAVMIKSNNNIVLVAVLGIIFVMMFKRKKFIRDILYIAVTLALSLSISPAVKSMYESRADVELGDAVPYISWFSMGLTEASNAPGWYSWGPTLTNFEVHNFDADAASEQSKIEIKEKARNMLDNPQYRKDFFYKKFVSQWNETSYQSIWNNKVRYSYGEKGKIAGWVCNEGEAKTKYYMDIYAQFIFMAVLFGLFACLKNKNLLSTVLPLIVLGGMLYHLLAEAKSQYSLSYFIYLIGFAAYGICAAHDYFAKKTAGSPIGMLLFSKAEVQEILAEPIELPAADAAEINETDEEAAEISENSEEAAETFENSEEATETSENSEEASEKTDTNDAENV